MYCLSRWNEYDYQELENISTVTRYTKKEGSTKFNNAVIMLDTETSKKSDQAGNDNHICAFSIAIRDIKRHENVCTLYGHDPDECMNCITNIIESMKGDKTIIYIHNLSYDWVFLRKFLMREFGTPSKQLNTKSHYPINIEFSNGLILKDSLILSQKSLDKWARDLDVDHKKSVGKWDYDRIRNQSDHFSDDELEYIEHDVLAGIECIDILRTQLKHKIFAMPYTATGIVREECRKIGKEFKAHDAYESVSPDYQTYLLLESCFHGGYTHANRYLINETITELIKCYDFKSSYPFVMLTEKYPVGCFSKYRPKTSIDNIIRHSDKYAFITQLILVKPHIKDNSVIMPVLQASKCTKTINGVFDNGRILCAEYVEIWVTDVTLKIIKDQYHWVQHICINNMYSRKDYLPRWFTDYIFKLFTDKCVLDGVDPLNYMLSKAKLNSCYGMCVQKMIQDVIEENYNDPEVPYTRTSNYNEEEYEKTVKNRNKFLPFQWGVWVTEYAMYNLHQLGKMCDTWVYSDTDSVFGINWNDNMIDAYNKQCLDKLHQNGYDSVQIGDKTFTLGVAELDKVCKEFRTTGAKRYCYRSVNDNELHITVAGVPKSGYKCLNDDINNFQAGLIFDGITTGKKQHKYIYIDDIYTDDNGNITGDSIDLSECDYLLDAIDTKDWYQIFIDEIEVQIYDDL